MDYNVIAVYIDAAYAVYHVLQSLSLGRLGDVTVLLPCASNL